MKRLLLAATVLALASVPGLANDQALLKDAQTYFKPIPSIVPAVKDNAVTRDKAQFWDGRAADLKAQAKGPIQAGVEMNNTPKVVEETLLSIPTYVTKFKAAFPNEPQPVTFDKSPKPSRPSRPP